VKGALTYPVAVICIGIVVTAVLLIKVTPVFAKMFADFGSSLPGPTQVVVDMSEWLQHYIIHIVLGIAAIVVAFTAFYRNPRGREIFDKAILYAPMVGDVIRKVAVARFTRTLGTMISSGVPILDALDVTAKTAGNRTIESGIMYVRTKISEGKNIAGPLAETKVFPSMVVQMIGVGEATGAMDQMLNKIADFYDDEVDAAVAGLTSMIEPIMMVFLGGVVGGFLISMYLPIFSIAGAIK
jgi:type IV pilus assembly protein PilC